jgi:secreted Zn-dependent insulinase-like peptidase
MKDDKYLRPKGMVSLKIYTGDCEFGQTAKGRVFVEIWNSILNESLREFYYMAQMASLHAAVSLPHDNVNIQWSGFSDSLPTFVEETLKRIKGLRVHDMPDTFAQVKEKLMQNWFNFYLEQAYQQAYFSFDNILLTTAFEKKQLHLKSSANSLRDGCRVPDSYGLLTETCPKSRLLS